jgi:hypothetical protein
MVIYDVYSIHVGYFICKSKEHAQKTSEMHLARGKFSSSRVVGPRKIKECLHAIHDVFEERKKNPFED